MFTPNDVAVVLIAVPAWFALSVVVGLFLGAFIRNGMNGHGPKGASQ